MSARQTLRTPLEVRKLLEYPSVAAWYRKRVGHSKITALYHLNAFIGYRLKRGIDPDPEHWIDECLHGNNLTLVQHLKLLKEWAEGETFDGSDDDTRIKYYRDVRSFYDKNFAVLPRSKLDIQRGETTVPTQVTATDFLKMSQKVLEHNLVTLRDRSVIMTMIQGGLDDSTLVEAFNFVAWPQLVKHFGIEEFAQWDEDKVPVKIDLVRPKTEYLHYTGMHHDAIMLLKQWLAFRVANYGSIKTYPAKNPNQLPISDPIYVSKWGKRLRGPNVCELFRDNGKRAGVNHLPKGTKLERYKGARVRYPFHSHECRDTLVTLARRLNVDVAVANFFVGHSIDRYQYDKSPFDYPDWFMEKYDVLASHLNILTDKDGIYRERYEKKLADELAARDKELAEIRAQNKAIMTALENPNVRRLIGLGTSVDPEPLSAISFVVQILLSLKDGKLTENRVIAIGINTVIGFAAGSFMTGAIHDVFIGAFSSALVMLGIYLFVVRVIRVE